MTRMGTFYQQVSKALERNSRLTRHRLLHSPLEMSMPYPRLKNAGLLYMAESVTSWSWSLATRTAVSLGKV